MCFTIIFLAKNWNNYSESELLDFTKGIYKVLLKHIGSLPIKSQARLPFMAKSNWLYNYRKIEGIKKSLTGLSKRTSYENRMDKAHLILKEKQDELQKDFSLFYPELTSFVQSEINSFTT